MNSTLRGAVVWMVDSEPGLVRKSHGPFQAQGSVARSTKKEFTVSP